MKATLIDFDLVLGVGSGNVDGVEIPAQLAGSPTAALRYDGTRIVAAASYRQFYIDPAGVKHIRDAGGWQPLVCDFSAELVLDQGVWRPQTGTEALAIVKEALKAEIDAEAETVRLRYITAGAGQAMVYQQKGAEADRLAADTSPDPAHYPILAASIGIDGATLADVAALVNATRAAWSAAAATIEAMRLGTKQAIDAAVSDTDARAARAAVAWPAQ
ncbi:hypothetical protein [Rhodopseudomonas sp. BR0G17]|uniref:hypothetical protein n=1 Tax=Rhodopseudomonas sp. BR0G17 TaxID=2269368 RepID=UPI0013DFCA00|nr:hypothetical protein [Rhodopseudomonas sp. BR0G17]NEW96654.1 hypothetical protein [Rhodopseudomonas sp. BR0G17]